MGGLYAEAGGSFCSLSHIARTPAERAALLPAMLGNVQSQKAFGGLIRLGKRRAPSGVWLPRKVPSSEEHAVEERVPEQQITWSRNRFLQ